MSSPEEHIAIPVGHAASVLDASIDPAFVLRFAHDELTIIGCNIAFTTLTGKSMSSLMRRTASIVLDEVHVGAVTELLASETDSRPVVIADDADPAFIDETPVRLTVVCMERTPKHHVAMVTLRPVAPAAPRESSFAVLDAVTEPILVSNSKGILYGGNLAGCSLTGRKPREISGIDFFEMLRPHERPLVAALLDGGSDDVAMVDISRPDGSTRTVSIRRRAHGTHLVLTLRDLTQQRLQEAELAELQAVDPLTGLANRLGLLDRIESIATAGAPCELQLAFIDLDNFKTINDALGHDQGDLVLQTVAKRLAQAVGGAGLVARLGGDEFVVVRAAEVGTGTRGFEDMLRLPFVDPIRVGNNTFVVSSSAGILTTSDRSEMRSDHALKCADLAMYEAKRRGKNTIAVYDDSLSRRASERLDIESDLRRALDNDEFELHYQPIMDVITGRVAGAEALIRWHHPERGMVRPDHFIPIAEQTGLIVPMGAWVIDAAVAAVTSWNQRSLARRTLSVSVNVSGLQLADPSLERTVHAALSRSGLDPNRLTIEVTESTLMSGQETMELLDRLAALGVGIAIDDFGTGYSSLSYLKRLPAQKLKIDKAFIDGLGSIPEDTALVTGIIGLASALDLALVAEGVETERQLRELRRLGCEFSQGYLHSKPLPAGEFEQWVTALEGRQSSRMAKAEPEPHVPAHAAPSRHTPLAATRAMTEASWREQPPGLPVFDQDA